MCARVLLLLLALPASASAQYVIGSRDSLTLRVDSVFRSIDRNYSPGCAVGVYRDDLFAGGEGVLEFTRDTRGRISGMVVQAGRVRNLRFTRRDTKQ